MRKSLVTLTIFIFQILPFAVFAQTNVSGLISKNTTWTVAQSPYVVVGDLCVEEGFSLTIEPGVRVQFDGRYYLYVDGSLKAEGSATDSIVFTSNKAVASASASDTISTTGYAWQGIKFRDVSIDTGCVLQYCRIQYAKYGVYCESASPTISNSRLIQDSIGVYCSSVCSPIISASEITRTLYGLTCSASGSYPVVRNNVITYNTTVGINISSSARGKVTGNVISYNGKGVVNAGVTDSNTITMNTYGFYYSGGGSVGEIVGNTIQNNGTTIRQNTVREFTAKM
jgi:parallel beta-helix repeat protein